MIMIESRDPLMEILPTGAAASPALPAAVPKALSADDHAALGRAVTLLEQASFATKMTELFGHQIQMAGRLLPERFATMTARATTLALQAAMQAAFRTLPAGRKPAAPRLHRMLAAASGAAGGAFGLASLPVELPISTTLMLRSIAEIARAEGEDIADPATALACLQVFALGGQTPGEASPLEGGYFAVRAVFAKTLGEATRFVLQRGVAEEGAPILVRFVSMIAARFGVVVTQKAMAQAVPVLGAASAATINYLFMQHFQGVARGHFTVRRLERTYGADQIREAYEQIRLARAGDAAQAI